MTTSESKGRFLQNESIINRFESRIGMLYWSTGAGWGEYGVLSVLQRLCVAYDFYLYRYPFL